MAEVGFRSCAGMELQHGGLPATQLRVMGRTAKDFGPIAGETLDVFGMPGVRKRVVQYGVLQAALMVGSGQSQESRLAAGKIEHRSPRHVGSAPSLDLPAALIVARATVRVISCAWVAGLVQRFDFCGA